MTTPSEPAPEGRRARKRRETESAITLAAIQLALERGYGNVTVEAICDRADVSRSTFFNYFPSRDSAIVGRSMLARTPEQIEAAFSAHPGDAVRGAIALLAVGAREPSPEASAAARLHWRLIAEQEDARRHYSYALIGTQQRLTEATLAWLTAHPETATFPDDLERDATLVVTAVYAVLYAVTEAWTIPFAAIEKPAEAIDRAIDRLTRTIGATA